MKPRTTVLNLVRLPLLALCLGSACAPKDSVSSAGAFSDQQIENLVRRSWQYVAMYNVNNKFAARQGGWNTVVADTRLKDDTMRDIARPNNDTFYISAMLDLRNDPVILEMPAFDSKYVSLMITGYDHYVNIPMSTRLGDFRKAQRLLIYSARTEGYGGESVEGVDRLFEATGDFVSAVLRVMPHANEPARLARIIKETQSVKAVTLSEFRGGQPKALGPVAFPPVGATDLDVFESDLPEVMQFVFNHTTFDPANDMDQAVLAAYQPLGVEPGKLLDSTAAALVDGQRFRDAAERIQREVLGGMTDPTRQAELGPRMFQPKGRTDLETVLMVSIVGPIGLPQEEAMYPAVGTTDGRPMNAVNDYVVRMTREELPPAGAFWSLTLYDLSGGFFVPNPRKKYSVGENAGMKLNKDGGIEIHVAAEKPAGVPEENWLPIERKDMALNLVLRVYVPDLERMKTWAPPKAETLGGR
jgi:hypothetical protein